MSVTLPTHLDKIAFDANGLIPIIAQDTHDGRVLMLAYANREALEQTLETEQAHYWSRSRNALWRKGEISGNTQRVTRIEIDCDRDAIIYCVEQEGGGACHRGTRSCFDAR